MTNRLSAMILSTNPNSSTYIFADSSLFLAKLSKAISSLVSAVGVSGLIARFTRHAVCGKITL